MKVPLILDNIVFTFQKAGGVSMYWYELLKRLGVGTDNFAVSIIKQKNEINNIYEKHLDYSDIDVSYESLLPPKLIRYLPNTVSIPEDSIYHSSYLRVALNKNITNILTLYDFSHDKGLATRFPANMFNIQQKKFGINRAHGLICISENTKKDLLHFYPHINPKKVKVIYLGANDGYYRFTNKVSTLFRNQVNLLFTKYVLYVGERPFYKNFNIAVDAVEQLKDYTLIIAGGVVLSESEKSNLESKLKGRYYKFEALSFDEMNQLYNYAFCLMVPSAYEGFGLPVLEAMKTGCPVITSNISSLPELMGSQGLMVNTINSESFIIKIKELEKESFRGEYIEYLMDRALLFNWDKMYEETLEFYETIHQTKNK